MKPIIFNGEMVRAILEGRKTQTRRPIKVQPSSVEIDGDWIWMRWPIEKSGNKVGVKFSHNCWKPKPHKVSDVLYVRETYRPHAWREEFQAVEFKDGTVHLCTPDDEGVFEIKATDECIALDVPVVDGYHTWGDGPNPLKWRPSIHMPQWAARIHLEVTRVRVERACDITEEDARAEGFSGEFGLTPEQHIRSVWQSIYGADAWEKWVWVYDFKRIK